MAFSYTAVGRARSKASERRAVLSSIIALSKNGELTKTTAVDRNVCVYRRLSGAVCTGIMYPTTCRWWHWLGVGGAS